jgi:hypothetical protein
MGTDAPAYKRNITSEITTQAFTSHTTLAKMPLFTCRPKMPESWAWSMP